MKIVIGAGSCGIAAGAHKVQTAFEAILAEKNLDLTIEQTGCIGTCYLEPIVDLITEDGKKLTFVNVTTADARRIVEDYVLGEDELKDLQISDSDLTMIGKQKRIVLRNSGIIDPERIEDYQAVDGYLAAKKCLTELSPEEIIETVKIAGLKGRGGAGFPTWFKWDAARKSPGKTKYMVCNADEGDPGAFMDRSVLESDPHALIEGMLIGAKAIGANEGVIYVRAEYPLAIVRLQKAIDQARENGFLGNDIFETGFDFDLRIKAGAGAFVCGEETALIASLEGERGMPRLKPPFPAQKGYWNAPTNINNVETFANVPWIFRNGGEAYAALGTAESKGTKVFALTGKVKRGGLVEIPMGLTLRDVIYEIGGGIKADIAFKAVQMGGPSGGCIPASLLDTQIDYAEITKTGAIMGSGGMVVMDENTCMVDMARFFLDFTCKESCGKCTYCRVGTTRMLEILNRITQGEGLDGDIELLEELCYKIKDGSMCGLGQTAPNPVLTTIKYFRNEYEDHIYHKKCTAKSCKPLLTYTIDKEKCVGCGACKKNCPVDAITGEKKKVHEISQDICIKCGKCFSVCKFDSVIID
ncbi:NADH-ubiquinone oxidoreductase-F iron-sulfur binding region domain-containing protein [Acetobacterium carbinolicum]|jgi:NADH-quinone oxidoreductase subunit F|uniref:NADH-quinone oxidoreductase subunit NuoF n=1 Tax=Acetobacterium TaxID=33951 RepID=UPI000DBEB59F|nr:MULTISPECIES: NADH-quinone oxidoreductase subunit NuoF [unclassified Acetobacterium]AWW25383.1 NADH-quinone oxidoreductase subunit F [Acetobacterium sp. KB-1]MDZ5723896.1 NADH-quinone oxidoreductase subunit NuoF [Acetobacterium sp. K1/6]